MASGVILQAERLRWDSGLVLDGLSKSLIWPRMIVTCLLRDVSILIELHRKSFQFGGPSVMTSGHWSMQDGTINHLLGLVGSAMQRRHGRVMVFILTAKRVSMLNQDMKYRVFMLILMSIGWA